ncbi:MAG: 1-(5-phosphoribosyl)-5-[(5-phosphoribosylamino)methylideneamino]imidazole-4-carboxamide isomerase [Myxococcota bacterium]
MNAKSFELIPALDMLDGQVVRLRKGDYAQVTVYDDDPVAMAKRLEDAGATRLHVVDLNAARSGGDENAAIVQAMLKGTTLRLQVGGGVRTREGAKAWLTRGVQRVVIGTAAARQPSMVAELCADHPGGVVIALDARGESVAVEGWQKSAGRRLEEFAREVDGWSPSAILYTSIERDGMGEGPAVTRTAQLQDSVDCTVIASGGIGRLEHIHELRAAGVRACVCGKALYSGAFTLEEAFAAAGR